MASDENKNKIKEVIYQELPTLIDFALLNQILY